MPILEPKLSVLCWRLNIFYYPLLQINQTPKFKLLLRKGSFKNYTLKERKKYRRLKSSNVSRSSSLSYMSIYILVFIGFQSIMSWKRKMFLYHPRLTIAQRENRAGSHDMLLVACHDDVVWGCGGAGGAGECRWRR